MIGRIHGRAALIAAGAAFALCIAPAGAVQIKVPDTKTTLTVGGYVKGDFYLDSDNDLGKAFDPTSVRLDGEAGDDEDDGAFGAHADQSRFRLGTSTETSYGALNTVIEGHFFGGSGFTLRHAYGSLGPVLAGQTWSLMVDEDTFASTVDFNGPLGTNFRRVPQLRLSLDMGEGFVGQMAVERGFGGNELPAFVGAVRYRSSWGAINAAGTFGRIDEGTQNVNAHAFHFGANFNVTDATQVVATLNTTRGLGHIWGSADATVMDASGDLVAQDSIGGIAGVSHGWTDSIRTGVYFGWAENDTDEAASNKSAQSVHANVMWSPVSAANIGFEIMHGRRETNAMGEGEATRVQIGVQYSF